MEQGGIDIQDGGTVVAYKGKAYAGHVRKGKKGPHGSAKSQLSRKQVRWSYALSQAWHQAPKGVLAKVKGGDGRNDAGNIAARKKIFATAKRIYAGSSSAPTGMLLSAHVKHQGSVSKRRKHHKANVKAVKAALGKKANTVTSFKTRFPLIAAAVDKKSRKK